MKHPQCASNSPEAHLQVIGFLCIEESLPEERRQPLLAARARTEERAWHKRVQNAAGLRLVARAGGGSGRGTFVRSEGFAGVECSASEGPEHPTAPPRTPLTPKNIAQNALRSVITARSLDASTVSKRPRCRRDPVERET